MKPEITITQGAVILAAEPCSLSPEEVLELYENDKSEAMLANCLAAASNQTGWIGHDLDDEDCTEYTRELFESWWKLYNQLVSEIRDILIKENNDGMNHAVENIGTHYMVKPFMERNGFRDGCGWWVPEDEQEVHAMMISPESYKKQFENASYEELIEERDGLLRFLQEYEKLEKSGDRTGPEWNIHPQPDVRYQVYMDYLAELIPYMREKYNKEYVWGDKSLCPDEK